MQDSNFKIIRPIKQDDNYKMLSLKLKILKNINSTLSYIISILCIIAWLEFIRFVFDLYSYFH